MIRLYVITYDRPELRSDQAMLETGDARSLTDLASIPQDQPIKVASQLR